jgi:hypothetical protein
VNVTIPLTGVHEIAGTVSAPDGHRLNHGLVRLHPTGEPVFSLATPVTAEGTFSFHRIPADHFTISVEDASDMKMTPRTDGAVRYQQQTLVQRYAPGAIDINVTDSDLTSGNLVQHSVLYVQRPLCAAIRDRPRAGRSAPGRLAQVAREILCLAIPNDSPTECVATGGPTCADSRCSSPLRGRRNHA